MQFTKQTLPKIVMNILIIKDISEQNRSLFGTIFCKYNYVLIKLLKICKCKSVPRNLISSI